MPVLMLVTVIIYGQSLDSGFFLDDYPNLGSLTQVKEHGYLSYILGGVSSNLGRPLSLATFALQHGAWPDNPFAFKFVNLLIHLINGILIYIICRLLMSRMNIRPEIKQHVFCLLTTALWLLHPLQQTTLLYTIQRMTELSALFTLAGILFYLSVRKYLIVSNSGTYYLLSGVTLSVFMVAAMLCKENGILLPLYILIIEFSLFASDERSREWRLWTFVFLITPLLLLVVYLLTGLNDELASYDFRGYSAADRLMTQATVLWVYLKNILFPQLSAFTLFNDDYPISTGIFSPLYTLTCIILTGAILVFALIKRKTLPVFSFGILWFFGGHILESSHLNLELYFDHRNYLPVFGILFLVNQVIFSLYEKYKSVIVAGGGLYYIFIIIITILSVSLWSSPVEQMRVVINKHPYSVRTNTYLLNSYIKTRDLVNARNEINNIANRFPGDIYPYLKDISVTACLEGKSISVKKWNMLMEMAKTTDKSRFDSISVLNNMTYLITNGYCEAIDPVSLIKLIAILMENKNAGLIHAYMYQMLATLYLNQEEKEKFIQMTVKAYDLNNSVPGRISYIQSLLMAGEYAKAMELLNLLENNIKNNKRLTMAYHKILIKLESDIKSNL